MTSLAVGPLEVVLTQLTSFISIHSRKQRRKFCDLNWTRENRLADLTCHTGSPAYSQSSTLATGSGVEREEPDPLRRVRVEGDLWIVHFLSLGELAFKPSDLKNLLRFSVFYFEQERQSAGIRCCGEFLSCKTVGCCVIRWRKVTNLDHPHTSFYFFDKSLIYYNHEREKCQNKSPETILV